MKKCLIVGSCVLANLSYGLNNSQFQTFDNQVSIGYSYSQAQLSNPSNSSTAQSISNNLLNLDIEHLFDNGVWFDVNGSFVFSANSSGNNSNTFLSNVQELGFPANLTGKVGYAFPLANTGLQLTPYASLGKVLNYNGVTLPTAGFNNSFYYLYGVGGRLEYVINPYIMLYFDQMAGYLSDQSGGSINLSSWDFNSALGAKFNLTQNLQVGLQGFYNQTNVISSTAGYNNVTYTSLNVNQSTFGGLVSIGYLYDGGGAKTSLWADGYTNGGLALFDNVYSLGIGYSQSNTFNPNSGTSPGVASTSNFLDVNVGRLFASGVWANLDAQLFNNITQTNTTSSVYNKYAPTYLGFPGSATASVGYGFPVIADHLQIIPYVNGGIIMNINSYTISQGQSLSYQLSHDLYVQYGGGARLEYAIDKNIQIYLNQLFANLDDRSNLGLGVWRSTSTLGANFAVYGPLQLGINAFYDQLTPTGSGATTGNTIVTALQQSTVGGLFSVGLRY